MEMAVDDRGVSPRWRLPVRYVAQAWYPPYRANQTPVERGRIGTQPTIM